MAERRMFAKTIIDSDAFLDMPLSTQALYFHLSMRADDEGFVNNPKKIARMIGADDDSLKLLIMKKFIIPFDSGIVVIKHWKIHNYIRIDRFKETVYKEERSQLVFNENGAYTKKSDECKPDSEKPDATGMSVGIPDGSQLVYQMETQDRLGKDRLGKDRLGGNVCADAPTRTAKRFTPPTIDEVQAYCQERKNNVDAERFIDYYTSNGWKVGKNPMKDWKAAVRTWERQGWAGYGYRGPAKQQNPSQQSPDAYSTKRLLELLDENE